MSHIHKTPSPEINETCFIGELWHAYDSLARLELQLSVLNACNIPFKVTEVEIAYSLLHDIWGS